MINRARPGGKCRCEQFGYARAVAANRSKDNKSNRGFGSLRRIFQTMMLIDLILRESANESVVQVLGRLRDSGLGTPGIFRVGLLTSKILRPNYPWKASPYDLDSYHPSL